MGNDIDEPPVMDYRGPNRSSASPYSEWLEILKWTILGISSVLVVGELLLFVSAVTWNGAENYGGLALLLFGLPAAVLQLAVFWPLFWVVSDRGSLSQRRNWASKAGQLCIPVGGFVCLGAIGLFILLKMR